MKARYVDMMRARTTGAVYLLYFLLAIAGGLCTAHGLPALGRAITLLSVACYAGVVLLFYVLFRPINAAFSAVATLLGLAGCALMTLQMLDVGSHVPSALFFFGPFCIAVGILIWKSTFLPWPLALLMVLAGLGWLTIQVPQVAHRIASPVMVFGFIAEAALMLWLLLVGADQRRPTAHRHTPSSL
jgi:hypothetical protein